LGGIGALSGGAKPTKAPRGDGTVQKSSKLLVFLFPCGGVIKFLNASVLKKAVFVLAQQYHATEIANVANAVSACADQP